MKTLVLSLCLLVTVSSLAQKREKVVVRSSLDFIYGQKLLQEPAFNGGLNDFSNFRFAQPLSSVGLCLTSSYLVQRGDYINFDGHYYYTQIIPQAVRVNDSTTSMITGFTFAASGGGIDFFAKKRNFDLLLCVGLNMGRLRLYDNANTLQKNPFFSPKLTLSPRFFLGRMSFIALVDYELDVSKKRWLDTKDGKKSAQAALSPVSSSGLTVYAGIGFALN